MPMPSRPGLTSALAGSILLSWLPAQGAEAIRKAAIPFATIDAVAGVPEDDTFEDLAPLQELIGDARIVMLGEESHGDGAAFLARTRLIAFLHEKMGFDVLCFESGLFSCELAGQRILDGTPAREAMGAAIFPIWMGAQELAPLVDYMDRRARTDRPLRLTGYDCQLTGSIAPEKLPGVLEQIETFARDQELGPAGDSVQQALTTATALLNGADPAPGGVAALRSLARSLRDLDDLPDPLWPQLLASLAGFGEQKTSGKRPGSTMAEKFNPRDAQGADNLLWLARERYRGKKIIVWAATMHILRDHGALKTPKGLDYTGVHSMGDLVAKELGDEVFLIGATAHQGAMGLHWGESRALGPAGPNTFEGLCTTAGLEHAIVPLAGLGKACFGGEPYSARPLGYAPMTGDWHRHLDAMLFQRRMTPATRYLTAAEREKANQLIQGIEQQAEGYRKRFRVNNPFADKGDFRQLWDEWVAAGQRSEQERREMEEIIQAWGAAREDDPAINWRVHGLLAHIASGREDHAVAMAEMDKAIAAYGDRNHQDPLRQSYRQHLENQRAMINWDQQGFAAAAKTAARRLQESAGYLYFHAGPWRDRIGADRQKTTTLRQLVTAAYQQRIAGAKDDGERRQLQRFLMVFENSMK